MLRKRIQAGANGVLLLLLVLTIAACGNENTQTQGDEGNTVSESNVTKNEPVTLIFYEGSSATTKEMFMEQFGNAIQTKFPHVTAEFAYVTNVDGKRMPLGEIIARGDKIDIIYSSIGSFHSMVWANELQSDITDLIKKHNFDLSRLDTSAVELMQKLGDGEMYGLPVKNDFALLVYNRDLFDKFGVDYPVEGSTWDDIYDLARTMSRIDGDVQYRGFHTSFNHIALMNQLSASFIDPKTELATFDSDDRWAKHVRNLIRFFQIPNNEVTKDTVSLAKANEMFNINHTLAMNATQISTSPLAPMNNVNWDIISLPEYSDLPGIGSQPYPTYFNITKMNTERDISFEVIAYLTSEEFQLSQSRLGIVPIIRTKEVQDAFGQEMPHLEGRNLKALFPDNPASPSVWTQYNAIAAGQFQAQVYEVAIGNLDVNTALRNATELVNGLIKEQKSK